MAGSKSTLGVISFKGHILWINIIITGTEITSYDLCIINSANNKQGKRH